ncbi:uncharacterized protein LOC134183916 [Corticium candelabrum]|uniref:uncharacterized protein LOC134183916 n=1 Tax=Corticium candelabrum TaxID=121492 RepID=UPI002E301512|nr:uncharacterized protein LOC134183916 [Corticium candelabrum]
MGACVSRCLQPWLESPNNVKRYRAQYSEHQLSIEVDALLDDDDDEVPLAELTRTRMGIGTEQDARDFRQRQHERIAERNRELESEKGRSVARDEENMRMEEEAYFEATKAAVRAAEMAKEREKAEQTLRDLGSSSQPSFSVAGGASLSDWLKESDVGTQDSTPGGESAQQQLEDFDLFLESVKRRSLSQRSVDQPAGSGGVDLLGGLADERTSRDDFTLFEESVMPTVTTAQ